MIESRLVNSYASVTLRPLYKTSVEEKWLKSSCFSLKSLPIDYYKVNGAAREGAQGYCLRFPPQAEKFYLIFLSPLLLYKGLMAFFSAKHSPIKKPLRVEAAFIIHFQQAIYSEEVRSTP
jgi:hypothetical protein